MKVHCFSAVVLAFLALGGCKPQSQTADTSAYDGTHEAQIPQKKCGLSPALTNRVIGAVYGPQVGALGLTGANSQPITTGEQAEVPLCDSATSARIERALIKNAKIAEACGGIMQVDRSFGRGGPDVSIQMIHDEQTGGHYLSIRVPDDLMGLREISRCPLPPA